jgi:membrane-associated protease RseP (regulator of RpoE activity)
MSQNPEMPLHAPPAPTVTACSNCHSVMPSELRFCRNCGFRLGAGVEEYNETIRFDGSHAGIPAVAAVAGVPRKRRRKLSGMTWIFIGLLTFFVCAAAFTAMVTPFRPRVQITTPVAPRSYVGVNEFETTEGGVTFGNVEAPDVPSDKAGLVGGDIITSFDGQPVSEEDQMMDLLKRTPIGKTVDVVFIRDGETKTTKLTTVSKEDYDRIVRAYENRPEGRPRLGYDDGEVERVEIPGTNIHGVKLNSIESSRPADLAGVKEGDIVIAINEIPIRTRGEFVTRVARAIPYSTIELTVIRGAEKLKIPVKLGRR